MTTRFHLNKSHLNQLNFNMIKKIKYLICLVLVGCGIPQPINNESIILKKLDSLYQHHQYFELQKQLAQHRHLLAEKEVILLESKLHSVFNRRKASDSLIAELLDRYTKELTAKQHIGLLETKVSNSLFLFNYKEAQLATEKLLKIDSLPTEEGEKHQNQLIIFQELSKTPPQKADVVKSEIAIGKDIAGLSRIPVKINNKGEEVVFDTGANFSVITDSLALKAGIHIKDKTFEVTAITGGKVVSRIGVADSLRIGNSLLQNVVFLVFPETTLSFKEANYTIDAILGLPVINALEKVALIKDQRLIILPAELKPRKENMAFDLLTPLVEVVQDGKSLVFTFDTGASTTALYEDYLKLNEGFIRERGIRDSINLGGAGGSVRIPVYKAPFSGKVGDARFHLKSANIHIQSRTENPGIYGNLGQDILQQFDTLSLDFRNMRVELK